MKDNLKHIASNRFMAASGNDEFPLTIGSIGARTEQLKQALNILGESISEDNFGMQTRAALIHLGYPPAVLDETHFNTIILRAYRIGKKQITLTEPELRALYEKEVSPIRRDTLTFDKWLKRQNIKAKIGAGGKRVFDVLFGWLKLKTSGVGNTGGVPAADQPAPTSTGFFSRTASGGVAPAVYVFSAIAIFGLGAWGVSALIKSNQKVVLHP